MPEPRKEPADAHLLLDLVQPRLEFLLGRFQGRGLSHTASQLGILVAQPLHLSFQRLCLSDFDSLVLERRRNPLRKCRQKSTGAMDGLTTAALSRGYGSGASARTLYTFRNVFSELLQRLVRESISIWYAVCASEWEKSETAQG